MTGLDENADVTATQGSGFVAEPRSQGMAAFDEYARAGTTQVPGIAAESLPRAITLDDGANVEAVQQSEPVAEAQSQDVTVSSKDTEIEGNHPSGSPANSQTRNTPSSEGIEAETARSRRVAMHVRNQFSNDNLELVSRELGLSPADTHSPTSPDERVNADVVVSLSSDALNNPSELRDSFATSDDDAGLVSSDNGFDLRDTDASPPSHDSPGPNEEGSEHQVHWDDTTVSDSSFGEPLVDPPVPKIVLTPPDNEVGYSVPPLDPERLRPPHPPASVEMLSASREANSQVLLPGSAPRPPHAGERWGRVFEPNSLGLAERFLGHINLRSERETEVSVSAHIEHVEDVKKNDSDF